MFGPTFPYSVARNLRENQVFVIAEGLVIADVKNNDLFLPLSGVPFLSGVSADEIVFSRDGKWAVYTTYSAHSSWRSRLDGS